jgi:hypothetical protein
MWRLSCLIQLPVQWDFLWGCLADLGVYSCFVLFDRCFLCETIPIQLKSTLLFSVPGSSTKSLVEIRTGR